MVLFDALGHLTTPDIGTSNAANKPSKQSKRESEENLKTRFIPSEEKQYSLFSLTLLKKNLWFRATAPTIWRRFEVQINCSSCAEHFCSPVPA